METKNEPENQPEKKGASKMLFYIMLIFIVGSIVVTLMMSHPHVGSGTNQAKPAQSSH
jgi:flagellar basal body-associated protein FliL